MHILNAESKFILKDEPQCPKSDQKKAFHTQLLTRLPNHLSITNFNTEKSYNYKIYNFIFSKFN